MFISHRFPKSDERCAKNLDLNRSRLIQKRELNVCRDFNNKLTKSVIN